MRASALLQPRCANGSMPSICGMVMSHEDDVGIDAIEFGDGDRPSPACRRRRRQRLRASSHNVLAREDGVVHQKVSELFGPLRVEAQLWHKHLFTPETSSGPRSGNWNFHPYSDLSEHPVCRIRCDREPN